MIRRLVPEAKTIINEYCTQHFVVVATFLLYSSSIQEFDLTQIFTFIAGLVVGGMLGAVVAFVVFCIGLSASRSDRG